MENKKFIKVETARKTQEQIDRENAERKKNENSSITRIVLIIVFVATVLAVSVILRFVI